MKTDWLKIERPSRAGLRQAWLVIARPLAYLILAASAVLWVAWVNPDGTDWRITLQPAIGRMFAGQSPYLQPAFFSPPWVLLPLIPFWFLPPGVDKLMLALTTLVVFAVVGWKLKLGPIPLALLLTVPPVRHVAYNGQIDWFLPLGLLLPRPLALFFILSKPQLGLGLAAYWLWDSWRAGGWRKVLLDFGPVGAALIASFAFFGFYLGAGANELTKAYIDWNVSLWPYSIPIGLALLLSAIRQRKQLLALSAGAFLSPYVAVYSVAVPLLGLADDGLILAVAAVSLWVVSWLS